MRCAADPAEAWMRRALRLARRGQGRVEPNPMVGCVLVRDGRVLGEGAHRRFGGPHAEVEALANCRRRGRDPAGCEVYVTLEPCAHTGKTPPCVDALIAAGVARVCAAMTDPSPAVSGRGIARLRDAGIRVEVGTGEVPARELNEPWLKRLRSGLPWVTAKWAQTVDGAIATSTGDSRWISNSASRRLVHRMRARMDAVVVGIGTVLADDPMLTARDVPRPRVARRVVVDPACRLPHTARVVPARAGDVPLTLAVREALLAEPSDRVRRLADRGVEVIGLGACATDPARLALAPLLAHLATARSATNVLVEGGATLLGTMFRQDLVDQVLVFIAPRLLADEQAQGALCGARRTRIDEADGLRLRAIRRVEDDVLLDYRVGGSVTSHRQSPWPP